MTEPGTPPVIGVIGGSGVYDIDGLTDTEWRQIVSPFGMPSDELLFGELDGQKIVFLPRHGRGHRVPPSGLNFRANIDALKRAGVTEILSISAVGSLKEEYPPGHFVLVDQFIDRTFARQKTFFDEGCVAHISMADPVCSRLGGHLSAALDDTAMPPLGDSLQIQIGIGIRDLLENGQIQKFAYTVELFWKYVRSVLLSEQRLVPNRPKGVLKDAVACGYLHEAEYPAAMQMYDDRNRCSHVYKQEIIPGILARLPGHLTVMQAVFGRLPPTAND